MVRDLHTLPQMIVVPRLDGEGNVEYALEFSGLPNQCGRCRSHEHQVRHYPRKEHTRKRESKPTVTTTPSVPAQVPSDMAPETQVTDREVSPQPIPPVSTQPDTQAPILTQTLQDSSPDPIPTPAAPDTQQAASGTDPGLHTNDQNFPKLPSSKQLEEEPTHIPDLPQSLESPPHFVWRSKPPTLQFEEPEAGGERKGKAATKAADSTPITRQGYRSGRLAEDFWTMLNPPNTPNSSRKTLQVIPFLLTDHNRESAEFLVDNKHTPHQPIAHVHIAELLAGLPWTESRARQHVVNEVAQALHKVLIFTNKVPNPFQKWKHGYWFAGWEGDSEGDHICTLYAIVQVQETKLKPRKGQNFGWRRVPTKIWERIHSHNVDMIEDGEPERAQWQQMLGTPRRNLHKPNIPTASSPNRFSVLSEEDLLTPQHQI